jgi:hypothetical protein
MNLLHRLNGSKTPGELALVLEKTTLITGDLVRAHQAGYKPNQSRRDRSSCSTSVSANTPIFFTTRFS